MEKPPSITFRGLDGTDQIRNMIDERIERLERHCDHIIGCDVAVELQQKNMRSGSNYRVRVDLTVPPQHEVVAEYSENDTAAPVPLEAAVQRAFSNAEKQLDKLVAKQRGDVKQHPAQEPSGVVTKLFETDRYGFLLSDDGREIYFRDSAVLDDRFDDLELGAGVHFVATSGDDGPQATSVRLVHKRGRNSPMETGT